MVRFLTATLLLLSLTGCSTLKGWFTAQGQKLALAQTYLEKKHPHAASALAVEALVIEPEYKEAAALLSKSFFPGQKEFQDSEENLSGSSDPARWDALVELYRYQETLARDAARFGAYRVPPVTEALGRASREASSFHLQRAREILVSTPGPRQARKALAEGRVAQAYDADTDGLSQWLAGAREAATQKLMVVPFFYEGRLGPISGPLASRVSRKLLEDAGLPELTTIFSSDRLVTLVGGGPARIGLISQPDALKLAAEAGQNLVLLGQITRASYQEPIASVKTVLREKSVVVVDPEHPKGLEKVYKAAVTTTVWSTSVSVVASFSLIEGPTGSDILSAVRESSDEDQTTLTVFKGDEEALTADDLIAVKSRMPLRGADSLWASALEALAEKVAGTVREGLR